MAANDPSLSIGGDMPPEYIAQLSENARRKAMAEAMLQQFTQGQQTQFVPGGTGTPIAVKQGGLGALAQALSGLNAGAQVQGYGAENEALRMQNDMERQKEYQSFVSNPDKSAAIATAMASRRPGVQKFGLEQQKREQDKAKDWASTVAPYDVTAAERAIRQGMPNTPFSLPTLADPSAMQVGPETALKIPKYNGITDYKIFPRPSTTSFDMRLPGQLNAGILAENTAELKAKKEGFDLAKDVFASAQKAVTALEAGAQAGGGESIKQGIKKALQFLGGDPAGLTETTQLSMALGDAILANARKLAPVTAADLTQLRDILGSVDTDPSALSRALAWNTAHSFKAMQDFNSFMDVQDTLPDSIKNAEHADALRSLYSGQRVGRDAPTGLIGPQLFQLETAKHLKNLGYDLSKLKGLPPGFANENPTIDMRGAFPATAEKTLTNKTPRALPPGVREVK
jgi:hypothetical protein